MTTTSPSGSVLTPRTVAGLEVLHRAGTGPTVVALAGLGSSGWAWEGLAEDAPDLDLYAVSLRGRGGSHQLTGEPGMLGHAKDVAAVVRELGLTDVVLVGHSMGAFLAPVVAQQLPGLVKHLVCIDGGIRPAFPFFMRPALTRIAFRAQLKKASGSFADVEALMTKARVAPMIAQKPEIRPQLVRMLERELEGPPGALRTRTDVDRCVADAVDCFFGPSYVEAVAALAVPAHVILAENKEKAGQKPFISDVAVTRAVAAQPLLHVTRIAGNHVTVVYEPEVVAAVRA